MNKPAIVRAPKPPWVAYVATIAAVLFIGFASVIPAQSGGFFPEPYGPPGGWYGAGWGGGGYGPGWHNCCGCRSCGCGPCGCGPCGCVRFCGPIVHRPLVVERRFVEREFIERVATVGWPGYGVGPWGAPDFYAPRPPAPVGFPGDYYYGGF